MSTLETCPYCGYSDDKHRASACEDQLSNTGHALASQILECEKLRKELQATRDENEMLMNVEYWPERARVAERELARMKVALNQIAILGMGALAYTSEFTEKVNGIARTVLNPCKHNWLSTPTGRRCDMCGQTESRI